jgi:hypothetical protein
VLVLSPTKTISKHSGYSFRGAFSDCTLKSSDDSILFTVVGEKSEFVLELTGAAAKSNSDPHSRTLSRFNRKWKIIGDHAGAGACTTQDANRHVCVIRQLNSQSLRLPNDPLTGIGNWRLNGYPFSTQPGQRVSWSTETP